MSRIALRVASDILALRVLVQEAERSLEEGSSLPASRRKYLAATFHHYLENGDAGRHRINAISRLHSGVDNPISGILRAEAREHWEARLRIIDRYAAEGLVENDEINSLKGYLTRVDAALERGRSLVEAGRYL